MSTQLVAIGELAEQVRGVSYAKQDASSTPGDGRVAILRAGNIHDTGLVLDDLVYVPRRCVAEHQMIRKNDVLVATSSGSLDVVGKAARATGDLGVAFGAFCKVLRPNQRVEARYFANYFRTVNYRRTISMLAAGANINNLRNEHLDNLLVRVPPLDEQRRIADILDRADGIRRKRREALALTDELLRSAFLEMFGDPVANPKGWPVKSLGDVSTVAGGLQVTSARANNPIALPYLRVANVYRDRLDLSEIKTIRATKSERERAILQDGDVLVVEGHGNRDELGRAAVWRNEIAGCTHQNHIIRVRPDRASLDPAFLGALLNSSSGRRQMLKLGKTTSGLNTISTNNIRSVQVVLPPVDSQAKYASAVRRVRGLASRMQDGLGDDEELLNVLVESAFSSSLDNAC